MQSSQPTSVYKNFKYRVTADLICLRLARTGFNYKIQWKRRKEKALIQDKIKLRRGLSITTKLSRSLMRN